MGKEYKTLPEKYLEKKGLDAQLKWHSACLVSVWLWVQSALLPNKY
jgi:hypothetical protein